MKSIQILFAIAFCLLISTIGNAQSYYVGGYVRASYYETGQISDASLLANSDIMYTGFNPYSDGHLFYEFPNDDATFGTGASYVSSLAGRNGVMSFDGTATAVMDGGQDLLIVPTGSVTKFTFATWVYVNSQSTFSPSEYLFRKVHTQTNTEVSLRLAANYGQITFRLQNNGQSGQSFSVTANQAATNIQPDQWYHIAVVYNGAGTLGNQVQMYVNGTLVTGLTGTGTTSLMPSSLPSISEDFILGSNFHGSLDETMVNTLALGASDIHNLYNETYAFNTWNMTKTVAFWNYDDATDPGKNVRSYVNVLNDIKTKIAGTNTKLRISVSGGDWQDAVSTATGRTTLANELNTIVTSQGLDGVDVDLEWPTANTEAAFANYSAFITALRTALGSSKTISLSLHPYYYKVGATAISTADYIALQVYGPQTTLWPMSEYTSAADAAISYGIPKNKLVMGLPFYGTTGSVTTAYKNIITANPTISYDADQAVYSGATYTYNGVTTIYNKAAYVRENGLAGVMSWDLANDVTDYSNAYSLMNATIRGLNGTTPVTLLRFRGTLQDGTAQLQWQSGVESNFNHFELQQSTDGKTFTTIANIVAKGSNSSYTYNTPQSQATAYYRLKMVDNDGSSKYSDIVILSQGNSGGGVTIYPNPAKSYINVSAANAGSIGIYDAAGRLVKTQALQAGVNTIYVSGLSAGIYYGMIGGEKVKFVKE